MPDSLSPAVLDLFQRLAIATAIGFLVGVERGWREREEGEGARTAGVRTFALYGLFGGLSGLLALRFGAVALMGLAFPFAVIIAAFHWREAVRENSYSVTVVVAGLVVYALGVYAVAGEPMIASAAGVATVGLLALRTQLHNWLRRLTWAEIRSAIILLAMTVIALPLLPNRAMGPYGAFNPYELWLITVVLGGVSFLAYVAARILGPRRGALTAIVVGALVSSTAVTLDAARQARSAPEKGSFLAGATAFASAVMAARTLAVAVALSPPLALSLAVPLGAFALVSALAGLWLIHRQREVEAAPATALRSPLELKQTFRFAAILSALVVVSAVIRAEFGAQGLLPMAAIAGATDVDAITLSTARLVGQDLPVLLGVHLVLAAVGANSLVKAAIAGIAGRGGFARSYGAATGFGLAAAGIGLLLA